MSLAQSWRIARLQAENDRLRLDNDALAERCRALACSCLVAEECCDDASCRAARGKRDWCDEAISLPEPD